MGVTNVLKTTLEFLGEAAVLLTKGAGYLANEVAKESTGIDFIGEYKETKRKTFTIDQDIHLLEENKEKFIEENGEDEYNKKLNEYKETKYMIEKARLEGLMGKVEKVSEERKGEYKEKVKNLSDRQLKYMKDNQEASKLILELVEEEMDKRGIS